MLLLNQPHLVMREYPQRLNKLRQCLLSHPIRMQEYGTQYTQVPHDIK